MSHEGSTGMLTIWHAHASSPREQSLMGRLRREDYAVQAATKCIVLSEDSIRPRTEDQGLLEI